VTNAQGCEASTTFNVTLHALPVVNLGPNLNLCGVNSQVLNAGNGGSSFLWSNGSTSQQITVTSSGNYSVTVTNANNCSASDAVQVNLNSLPIDALTDVTTCATTSVTLDAGNSGSTYLWSNGLTSRTIQPTSSGTYSVTVTTAQNCSSTFDAVVALVPTVSVSLGADTTLCTGNSVILDAGNPGLSYAWSNGATTRTITVDQAGLYSVTVSNGSCNATDAITIAVQAAPTDPLQDETRCVGIPITLDAVNPGCSYAWSTGSTAQTITVTTAASYTVTVTNAIGCSNTFDAVVQFVQPPVVQLGPDTTLCQGRALLLDAGNPGTNDTWSNGSTARTISVTQPGTYSVQVDNGHCQRMDAVVVNFNPSPAQMAARQFHTCLGEDEQFVRIDAGNPGSDFEWNTGEHSQVILAGAYGWYVVDVINQFDCAARDSAQVIEYCPSAIFIPNTFTPNSDGTNDIFIPVGKNIVKMHLWVFDRWGNQLFESDNPTMGWDGTYGGEVVKNDMYVWRLAYQFEEKDGTIGMEQEQMGHIQVLR